MIDTLKNIFGGSSVDYKQLVQDGAKIIDVRSPQEFASGHVKGSINIPLGELESKLHQIGDKKTPVITCCASGMRSGVAKGMLKKKGYEIVHNGGGWVSLNGKLA